MEFFEIKNKEEYNKYIADQKYSQFSQSWEWGDFQTSVGFPIFRYGIRDNGKLIFATTVIKKSLPRGKAYFYLPRVGIEFLKKEEVNFFFLQIKEKAKKENIIFLRFEPCSDFQSSDFINFRFIKTLDVQPSRTVILDLNRSEDEILKAMHQKTRYNIRLAKKKGVVVEELKKDNFEEFWELMRITGERDGFRLHGKEYYEKMIDLNHESRIENYELNIKIFVARYEGKILAANIVSFFGDMVTYVHGASSNEHRNLMAPYLLQWEVIKKAKDIGFVYYDFHGIDEDKWPGVTRFKKGFRGEEIEYPGAFDLVFNKLWYNVYKIVRLLMRRIRSKK